MTLTVGVPKEIKTAEHRVAMTPDGVRELKAGAAGIVRHVREEQATYVVTHRGVPVGVLMPIGPDGQAAAADDAGAWNDFLQAGRRLEKAFRPGKGGVKELSSSRRYMARTPEEAFARGYARSDRTPCTSR